METTVWDRPATDEELNTFWGGDWRPEPHDRACNAIRAIHYIDFGPETAVAILAALIEKIEKSPATQSKKQAVDDLLAAVTALG